MGTDVHTEFYQLKMDKTISDGFKLLHIPGNLDTVVSHKFLDVTISV